MAVVAFVVAAQKLRAELTQEVSSHRETKRALDESARRIQEYESILESANRRAEEEHANCKEAHIQLAAIREELEEQSRLRQEAEELLRKERADMENASRRIEGYESGLESANRRAEEERAKCEETHARLAAALEDLEKESRLRMKAEDRARRECAEKQNAMAALGKLQRENSFEYEELKQATGEFSEGNKVGEGEMGYVYKGELQHTTVAIKVLKGARGREEFEREVELLGSLHHPHIVMLLGACPSKACIVYEYMSHGSLDDHLRRKHGTRPLPWYVRFRICAEIAIAVSYLHSRPEPIILHRYLKPGNIHFDRHYLSKISDVGISRLLPDDTPFSVNTETMSYIDPDFQRTGDVSRESDVYALGMIMLQLLTGKHLALGVAGLVEKAAKEDNLRAVLDASAGDWPLEKAGEMANLALECIRPAAGDRPKLENRILAVLKTLRAYAAEAQLAAIASASPESEIIVSPISENIQPADHEQAPVQIGVGVGRGSSGEHALRWALESQTLPSNTIYLIHVYRPLHSIPTPMGNRIAISQVNDVVVKWFQEERLKETEKLMDKYRSICLEKKVTPKVCYVVGGSIQQELVNQTFKLGLTKLVLGTSTKTNFARLISRQKPGAIPKFVAKNSPPYCTVFIVCNGKLDAVKDKSESLSG